jgi:hypothetical protein
MVKELALKPSDLFVPARPGRKPVQIRKLAS